MTGQRLRNRDAEFKFLAFSEIYGRLSKPKTRRQAFMLLEAAVACLARDGFKGVTLTKLAREAGVARSLLTHYFRDLDEILEYAIKYIRLLFQKFVVRAMAPESSASALLDRYLEACFAWVGDFRKHALVWLSFLHWCAVRPTKRRLNNVAVRAGFERLESLLMRGQAAGEFVISDISTTASLIQNILTGGLICLVSEDHEYALKQRDLILGCCRTLVGRPS